MTTSTTSSCIAKGKCALSYVVFIYTYKRYFTVKVPLSRCLVFTFAASSLQKLRNVGKSICVCRRLQLQAREKPFAPANIYFSFGAIDFKRAPISMVSSSFDNIMAEDSADLSKELDDLGSSLLLRGDVQGFRESVSVFTSAISLGGPSAWPLAWKRGLALYYSKRFHEASNQFKIDMEANGSDVEEVVWKYLCDVRHFKSRDEALKHMVVLEGNDPRVPFAEILALFQGKSKSLSPETIFSAAAGDTDATAYGNFYVGLWLESKGDCVDAYRYFELAAEKPSNDFMGKLMKMHFTHIALPRHGMTCAPRRNLSSCYSYSSVILGGWQLSAGHHEGGASKEELFQTMESYVSRGISSFDMGDIYTGVERFVGEFLQFHVDAGGSRCDIEIHTKFVPDLDILSRVDADFVKGVVARSCARLGVATLDLVQFHWWDYNVKRYVDVARYLAQLSPVYVKHIGTTNFDAQHLEELLNAGIPIVSNQVQYSVLDRRVENRMVPLCIEHNVKLLCYGTLAGGFLTDKWLGMAEPAHLENRSLVKYKLIIDEFGGWDLFQKLLQAMSEVGKELHATIAQVAMAYVLQQPQVGGIIVGARNGKHLETTIDAAARLKLETTHVEKIQAVIEQSKGPNGFFYQLERDREGPHGKIMRYNCGRFGLIDHCNEFIERLKSFLDTLKLPWDSLVVPEQWENFISRLRRFEAENDAIGKANGTAPFEESWWRSHAAPLFKLPHEYLFLAIDRNLSDGGNIEEMDRLAHRLQSLACCLAYAYRRLQTRDITAQAANIAKSTCDDLLLRINRLAPAVVAPSEHAAEAASRLHLQMRVGRASLRTFSSFVARCAETNA